MPRGYAYKGLRLGGRVSASRGVCIQGVGLPPQLEKWAYASYWNAFLLTMRIFIFTSVSSRGIFQHFSWTNNSFLQFQENVGLPSFVSINNKNVFQ